jgi:hypothetical protein
MNMVSPQRVVDSASKGAAGEHRMVPRVRLPTTRPQARRACRNSWPTRAKSRAVAISLAPPMNVPTESGSNTSERAPIAAASRLCGKLQ